MPRYVVERTFPAGLQIPGGGDGEAVGEKTFCVYDAPSPEAVRKTAGRSELPATA
jgi:Protein of unknown function (DUF4242)